MRGGFSITILIGILIFALAYAIANAPLFANNTVWFEQVFLKCNLLLLSIFGWLILKIKTPVTSRNFNLQLTLLLFICAMLLGGAGSCLMIIFQLPSHPLVTKLNFTELVLIIWVWSSFTEEIFIRGFIHRLGHCLIITSNPVQKSKMVVLAGALVFGLIHAAIYIGGGALSTTIFLMCFTFVLGLMAGRAKEKSGIVSAVIVHVGFNMGGFVAGELYFM